MTIDKEHVVVFPNNNPYQSPQGEPDIDAKERLRPSLAWEIKQALLLVLGAFVGGFVGNPIGTIFARIFQLIPGPFFQTADLFEIRHMFGLGMLIVGSFVGAGIGLRAASSGNRVPQLAEQADELEPPRP